MCEPQYVRAKAGKTCRPTNNNTGIFAVAEESQPRPHISMDRETEGDDFSDIMIRSSPRVELELYIPGSERRAQRKRSRSPPKVGDEESQKAKRNLTPYVEDALTDSEECIIRSSSDYESDEPRSRPPKVGFKTDIDGISSLSSYKSRPNSSLNAQSRLPFDPTDSPGSTGTGTRLSSTSIDSGYSTAQRSHEFHELPRLPYSGRPKRRSNRRDSSPRRRYIPSVPPVNYATPSVNTYAPYSPFDVNSKYGYDVRRLEPVEIGEAERLLRHRQNLPLHYSIPAWKDRLLSARHPPSASAWPPYNASRSGSGFAPSRPDRYQDEIEKDTRRRSSGAEGVCTDLGKLSLGRDTSTSYFLCLLMSCPHNRHGFRTWLECQVHEWQDHGIESKVHCPKCNKAWDIATYSGTQLCVSCRESSQIKEEATRTRRGAKFRRINKSVVDSPSSNKTSNTRTNPLAAGGASADVQCQSPSRTVKSPSLDDIAHTNDGPTRISTVPASNLIDFPPGFFFHSRKDGSDENLHNRLSGLPLNTPVVTAESSEGDISAWSDLSELESDLDKASLEAIMPFRLLLFKTLMRKFLAHRHGTRHHIASSQEKATTAPSRSSGGSNPENSRQSRSRGLKRIGDNEPYGDGDDEENAHPSRKRISKPSDELQQQRLLACPFCKNNPRRYRRCYTVILREIARVKYSLSF